MEVATCMTAMEQGLSAGKVMHRLTAEDYAVDAVSLATAAGWETRRRCWRTRAGKESECEGHRFVV